jgi:hypothetical protein
VQVREWLVSPICCGCKSESEKEKYVNSVQESFCLKISASVEEASLIFRSLDAQVLVQTQR